MLFLLFVQRVPGLPFASPDVAGRCVGTDMDGTWFAASVLPLSLRQPFASRPPQGCAKTPRRDERLAQRWFDTELVVYYT